MHFPTVKFTYFHWNGFSLTLIVWSHQTGNSNTLWTWQELRELAFIPSCSWFIWLTSRFPNCSSWNPEQGTDIFRHTAVGWDKTTQLFHYDIPFFSYEYAGFSIISRTLLMHIVFPVHWYHRLKPRNCKETMWSRNSTKFVDILIRFFCF